MASDTTKISIAPISKLTAGVSDVFVFFIITTFIFFHSISIQNTKVEKNIIYPNEKDFKTPCKKSYFLLIIFFFYKIKTEKKDILLYLLLFFINFAASPIKK